MVHNLRRNTPLRRYQIRKKLRGVARLRSGISVRHAGLAGPRAGRGRRPVRRSLRGPGRRRGETPGQRRDRRPHQGVKRIEAVLRRLHRDVVIHPGGPVHPLRRRNLAAAAQRDQQTVGDITLRHADQSRLGPIHLQTDLRIIHHLMNMHVRRARNTRHAPFDLLRDLVIAFDVAAGYLHVHRSGQAEIQNLIRNIRRAEEERALREIRHQLFAQFARVFRRLAAYVAAQRNQNVAVAGADGRAVAVSQIEAAVRQADIVVDSGHFTRRQRIPDIFLDARKNQLGLFNARSGRSPRMQPHLTGIHRREEVAPDEMDQPQRPEREQQKARQHRFPVIQCPVEQRSIKSA